VDIYNATANHWSTAILSEARGALAATSLTNVGVAIFAGGWNGTWFEFIYSFLGFIAL
jgi:hypothetical protein